MVLPAALYTIGYQKSRFEDLLAVLSETGIVTLIDVRDSPFSRLAQFSRPTLAKALGEAGIAYHHLGGLGNPTEGREAAQRGDQEGYRRIMMARLATPRGQADLGAAIALSHAGPACLLCQEREPSRCHRILIAAEMAHRAGFHVIHLKVPADDDRQPSLF